jgi:hypothetical protein
VVIKTTVAPGTTEFVAYPIMRKAFQARGIESAPLLSHSYERVMPGRQYVASIRDFWRVCSVHQERDLQDRPLRGSRVREGESRGGPELDSARLRLRCRAAPFQAAGLCRLPHCATTQHSGWPPTP